MRVALAVGGGIAAYKAAELTRLLITRGHQVQVILTRAAQEFVQPLTFATLSGQKVITDLFATGSAGETLSSAVEHISVGQENEALVVAPATANLIGKFAGGIADDFASTLYLAFRGVTLLAPAMNTAMWEHPAVQTNLQTLRARGCFVVEPDAGFLACGTVGAGRLPEPAAITDELEIIAGPKDLAGESILITAGPTEEAIDPVRYISNRSSGKMGYALAEAAARRGAAVVLVSGPTSLPRPAHVQFVQVKTALEMRDAVLNRVEAATIIIKAAAVADFYLPDVPSQKRKKTTGTMTLELQRTPDILAEVSKVKGDRLLVGFAAETENLLAEGMRKLRDKRCDMLIANRVDREGLGFNSDRNEVEILTPFGEPIHVDAAPKRAIAERILDEVATLKHSVRSARS